MFHLLQAVALTAVAALLVCFVGGLAVCLITEGDEDA